MDPATMSNARAPATDVGPGQPMRFAFFGAGFWSRFQLRGWRELPGVECVVLCDPVRDRAQAVAAELGIPAVETEPERVFARTDLDFIDIASAIESHVPLVLGAARRRVPVICQKPLAPDLGQARQLVRACAEAGVPLFVHENFRWQRPIRAVRDVLASGVLGTIIRARVDFISGFNVFDNQPALRSLSRFLLMDLGVHTLDVVRFLFGEAETVYCRTQKMRADIRGEDVATVCLGMRSGATVVNNLAYAGTPLVRECFPQTLLFVEGTNGSLELAPDYVLYVATRTGTTSTRHPPDPYPWIDPAYAVVHSSIVACNHSVLETLRGAPPAKTQVVTGRDNFETLRLVSAAYDSASRPHGTVIRMQGENPYEPFGDQHSPCG